MSSVSNITVVFKREIKSYFESPVAYVFMVGFLVLTGFLTFAVSSLFERQSTDLQPFFFWHPWVYLLLVPAATMGLWAEEQRAKTLELLLTMPITLTQAILGKFLAGWVFIMLGLAMTFPIVITTAWLGDPDSGLVISGYAGSALLAGACVSIGMLASSFTRSQVIAFVVSLVFCLILLIAGFPPVTDYFARLNLNWLVDGIASLSLFSHFQSMQKGVIDLRDVAYYVSVMAFMIFATHTVLSNRRTA